MSPPPLDDDDLSADLDGVAGDDVHRQISADPDAQARQAALRAAADAVGRPVPPLDHDVVDELIGKAMADVDEPGEPAGDTDDGPIPDAIPLTPRRPRRGRSGGPRRWLVAAVVVVLAAIGLGLIRSGLNESDSSDTASTPTTQPETSSSERTTAGDAYDESPDPRADAAEPQASSGGPLHGEVGESPPGTIERFESIPDIGSFASDDALRSALRTSIPDATSRAKDATSLAAANRCASTVENQFEADQARSAASATLDGRKVLVYELKDTPPGEPTPRDLVVAVDREACTPELSFFRDR